MPCPTPLRRLTGAFLALLISVSPALAAPEPPGEPEAGLLRQSGTHHDSFVHGEDTGLFEPDRVLNKAEFAQMLYSLLAEQPEAELVCGDVSPEAWYYPAVAAMVELGRMELDEEGCFHPTQLVSRAWCAQVLDGFLPRGDECVLFPDVPASHWAFAAIGNTAALGIFEGDEQGNFNPLGQLTRAQAVTVLCRALGRTPDRAALAACEDLTFFPDLSPTHWAWPWIMEAVTPHDRAEGEAEVWENIRPQPVARKDGFYRMGGWLYEVKNGNFLHDTTDGVFAFDAGGRYTTGNPELDRRLNAIVEAQTDASMDLESRLRALYVYERDNYRYLSRPHISKGSTGWEVSYALQFLEKGKGNCYGFASTYAFLCREIGVEAWAVIGEAGEHSLAEHCWTEAVVNGTRYMFDTQLEQRYLHTYHRPEVDLYEMDPAHPALMYAW